MRMVQLSSLWSLPLYLSGVVAEPRRSTCSAEEGLCTSEADAHSARASSLLQGRVRSRARERDLLESETKQVPWDELMASSGLMASAASSEEIKERQSRTAHDLVATTDLAIGLVSGRTEYWGSAYRSMLQYTHAGVLIDVPGECPCGFRAGFETLRSTYPDAKWYYVGDEDAFINMRNLLEALAPLDPTVPTLMAQVGFSKVQDVCGIPSPMPNSDEVFFGGTGHIVSAAMLEELDYTQPCEGAHTHADRDHSCFVLSQWKPHFRYVPMPNTYDLHGFTPEVTPSTSGVLSATVVHKVTPDQQDALLGINLNGLSLGRTWSRRVVRMSSNCDCNRSQRVCLYTCNTSDTTSTTFTPQKTFLLHIAKAAGTSAASDLPKHLPEDDIFVSDEICLGAVPRNAEVITFVREPKAHVLSQYNMCLMRQKWPGANLHPLEMPSLTDWLTHWNSSSRGTVTDPLDCYMPVNLQTRLLSCRSPRFCPGADRAVLENSRGDFESNAELALSNIMSSSSIKHVGITELYQESMCLIHVVRLGFFAEYCDCEKPEEWDSFPHHHEDHGTHDMAGYHDVTDLDPLQERLIDMITKEDRELYAAAKRRLVDEIRHMEFVYSRRILCKSDAELFSPPAAMPLQFFQWDEELGDDRI